MRVKRSALFILSLCVILLDARNASPFQFSCNFGHFLHDVVEFCDLADFIRPQRTAVEKSLHRWTKLLFRFVVNAHQTNENAFGIRCTNSKLPSGVWMFVYVEYGREAL